MGKNGSSKLVHVLMLLLLLSFIFQHTESALPAEHGLPSITGRRILAYYKHDGAIGTPSSRSRRGGGGHDSPPNHQYHLPLTRAKPK
ncbi:hypothetical protein CARUB_v10027458mg, partial [Capsella rubella]